MTLRRLALLLALSAGLSSPVTQAATTGTLRFVGQVNAGTCNLAAGDVSRTITLPTIKVSDFGTGNYTGSLNFEVSADCEADLRNVTFLFAGTPSVGNAGLFANTGTSGGTALWLTHSGDSTLTIPANGTPAQRSRTVATVGSRAVLPLRAHYAKTNATGVTQGTLASTVTVSITYN